MNIIQVESVFTAGLRVDCTPSEDTNGLPSPEPGSFPNLMLETRVFILSSSFKQHTCLLDGIYLFALHILDIHVRLKIVDHNF